MSETMDMDTRFMDCVRFEEIVHDLDRPGTQGAQLRESALAHAESCSRCAQLLTEAESLDLALHAIATKATQQAPRAIEAVLLQRFRGEKDAVLHRKVAWEVVAFGIAAAVLLAIGISLHRFAPGMKGTGQIAQQGSGSAPIAATQTGQTASAAEEEGSASMASFIPLPYADDPEGLDGGAIVRVQLSGPALASLGMPVTLAGSSESVPADLLVSNDGTPEAIRLVSQENASQEF